MKHKKITILLITLFLLLASTSFVSAGTITTTNISARQDSATNIKVTVSGITATNGVKSIVCPAWSDKGGQDDLIWYPMNKEADGSYTINIDITNHNKDAGNYNLHIYGTDNSDTMTFLGFTNVVIHISQNSWERYGWDGSKFVVNKYTATLNTNATLNPNVTANNETDIKSGYGYTVDVNSTITASASVDATKALTGIQTVNVTFPEFNYEKGATLNGVSGRYNRLGQVNAYTASGSTVTSTVNLKPNPFSTNNSPVHFTPFWFPDANYVANVEIYDAWTPAGMLSASLTPSLSVKGQVYDDWHVAPVLND